MLPLQSVWAAAAAYCTHESGVLKHFGHHEHEHWGGSTSDLAAADPTVPLVDDNDCEFCHLACAQPVSSTVQDVVVISVHDAAPAYRVYYDSYLPPGLERPDRSLAA